MDNTNKLISTKHKNPASIWKIVFRKIKIKRFENYHKTTKIRIENYSELM